MPLPSSQTSASSSPSLKRKQPTISSFFTKKPLGTQHSSPNEASNPPGEPTKETDEPKNTKTVLADDGEDIVAPAPKRTKQNGRQSEPRPQGTKTKAKPPPPTEQPSQSSSHQGTELSKFASSSAVELGTNEVGGVDNEEARQRQKEREKLHQKFVRRLGGADCLIGIGRSNVNEAMASTEAGGGEEEEEVAQPVQLKGKAAGKKGGSKLTPMEKQVIDIKRKNLDTILLVEVGYKFKFFGEDARVAAKELSIVCIPGKFRYDEHPSEAHLDRFASASIPVPRLHVHVKRLVTAGHKVGVVRQLETAALKAAGDNRNAPFVRKLTNVYTKSTYIDDMEGLEGSTAGTSGASSTGYILCITETNARGWGNDERVHLGIVAVQPTTGDIVYDEFDDGFMRSEIETRLLHIAPCELLIVGELSKATEKLVQHLSGSKTNVFGDQIRVERVPKAKTATAESHSQVSSFYAGKMKSVDVTAADEVASNLLQKVLNLPDQVTICLSAMINHMTEYGLEHILELTKYFQHFSSRSHMLLNGNTLTSLEIYQNQTDHSPKGSLFWTLDRTQTRFGQRMLRKWVGRPLLNRRHLEERVNAVEELKNPQNMVLVERTKTLLSRIKHDLEKGLIRIYYGKCSRPELLNTLQAMQMIAQEFADIKSPADTGFSSPAISQAIVALPTILNDVVSFLNKINMHAARNDDKYAFFREEEETEEISEHKLGIGAIEHELEEHRPVAGEILGRKTVTYVSVAGIDYLIEVDNSSAAIKRVPASWVKISGTKKLSRFHTPEVIKLIRQRDQHREALAAACDQAFLALQAEIAATYQTFRDCVQSLATLDCLISLATIASQPGYVKPEYSEETSIHVQQGRHPMVEQLLLDSYVPNDIDLDSDKTRALLVTGPNMGGKSSYVRQVALIAIMGQIGSYVPAQSAKLGMLDAVFTRMGAFDNMLAGESTFMVELSETADILKQATPRSLVILDELGRGTSTHDGVAIAQAVLDYMVRSLRSLTLFITHYQHLASMVHSFSDDELRNVHMRFSESEAGTDEDITFLYEIGEGVAHRSYGLNVARLANLPVPLLDMAKQKSAELEEKIRRRRLAGLVAAVGDVMESGEEGMISRLISSVEELSGYLHQAADLGPAPNLSNSYSFSSGSAVLPSLLFSQQLNGTIFPLDRDCKLQLLPPIEPPSSRAQPFASRFNFLNSTPRSITTDAIWISSTKGRLQQATLDLLSGCDIQFRRENRLDIALVKNLPIALIFLPAADIPTFIGEGRVDLGITGRDQVAEHDAQLSLAPGEESGVQEILDLGFGGCKLQVQVPENGEAKQTKDLIGKNVVTSFTGLSEQFFHRLEKEAGVEEGKTKIKYVGGSVEAACALGVADGIVDLVESGETMRAAGLVAIDTVVTSTAVLVQNRSTKNPLVNLILSRIRGVITAQKFVLCQYNIPRASLAIACNITPGKRAPTITALEEDGWVAISSMVEKKKIATVMDELTKVGATDILVLGIANSRTD
ncbi:muts domain V-domain-containing protein [Aspergillus californicus]